VTRAAIEADDAGTGCVPEGHHPFARSHAQARHVLDPFTRGAIAERGKRDGNQLKAGQLQWQNRNIPRGHVKESRVGQCVTVSANNTTLNMVRLI